MTPDPFASKALEFFDRGGPFMIVLLALSLASLTVILLRAWRLREVNVVPATVVDGVEALQPGDTLEAFHKSLVETPSPLSRILLVLLHHLNWSRSENLEAVQTAARHEIARLEKGLVLLEIASGVAPLIGLLGTLSGLVTVFTGLGDSADPVLIARGISEALNTTIMGLVVAVPSLIAHSHFSRRIEVMALDMEAAASDLLAKIYQPAAREG